MKKKTVAQFIDYGFGFPVRLLNVPMIFVHGVWTPHVNYNHLAKEVLRLICIKEARLTGDEVAFIRSFFDMTLQQFAARFAVTHPGVLKWEKSENRPTGMSWAIEKDIRLFAMSKLSRNSKDLRDLYNYLEVVIRESSKTSFEVDARKLAA